jgi:hypothetical protein
MTFSFLEIGIASKETVPKLHNDEFYNHSCMPFVSFISIPSFVAQCYMWGYSDESGLSTGEKGDYSSGRGCGNDTRLALELDGRAGVSTVCFFIGGEQQPYRVTKVPRGVRFGVCFVISYFLDFFFLIFLFR